MYTVFVKVKLEGFPFVTYNCYIPAYLLKYCTQEVEEQLKMHTNVKGISFRYFVYFGHYVNDRA